MVFAENSPRRVSAAGEATKPTACTLRRCVPDWGCAGPCAWSLHKVLQVVLGNPWVVHAGAPGDVHRQGTSGEGGHGVEREQNKSRGWFSFQVPGRGSRRPCLAARIYASAGGQGVEQGSLSTRNPPWERGGKVRARGGRRGHGGQAAWACGGIQNLKTQRAWETKT